MDPARVRRNPDKFKELLQQAAEGLALFHPAIDGSDGGAVGDCGYIDAGRFWKLFNVFDPPEGLPALAAPNFASSSQRRTEILPNTGILTSSSTSSFSGTSTHYSYSYGDRFEIEASLEISQQETSVAFLAFGGDAHEVDEWSGTQLLQQYLLKHEDLILQTFWQTPVAECGLLLLHGTTKASAWCGGVASGVSTAVKGSIRISAVGVSLVDAVVSRGSSDNLAREPNSKSMNNLTWAFTRGPSGSPPPESSHTYPHCVIVRPVVIRRRARLIRLARSMMVVRSSGPPGTNLGLKKSSSAMPKSGGATDGNLHSSSASSSGALSSRDAVEPSDDEEFVEQRSCSILDTILDSVLEDVQDLDAAASDWNIISQYTERYGTLPGDECVKLIRLSAVEAPGTDACVAFLDSLHPPNFFVHGERLRVGVRVYRICADAEEDDQSAGHALGPAIAASAQMSDSYPSATQFDEINVGQKPGARHVDESKIDPGSALADREDVLQQCEHRNEIKDSDDLVDTGYVSHNGRPLCEQCYINLRYPKCGGCDLPVTEGLVQALNRSWHWECLTVKCANCDVPIQDELFERDSKAYCTDCFGQMIVADTQPSHCEASDRSQ
ncbi:hypothetical protein EXIGLDRAFT_768861 [Exidia glandulosa HHB12029]|uniref:LIM zinc-binding domain-containing protein n=1 Tax=Exidia glandulosa HHB12029 TaxID=1314781 RepID=A0A165HVW6_EXIGL|nr:hypothetical protein EXIGLDRAFT_768861 [Exidia glandulosa HHB12029]